MRTRNTPADPRIREIRERDRPAVRRILLRHWGGPGIVTCGRIHNAHEYAGVLALSGDQIVGLLTYQIRGRRCEVVTLNSFRRGLGIGTRLLTSCERRARVSGCREVWLITTNDNLHAIGFYQRRGMFLRAIHENAIEHSRLLKPSIPRIGMNGIPIRDEVEMYKVITPAPRSR